MLGLPVTTELSKQLPKKAIYEKFQMNTAAKEKVDADISKMYIANEVSPSRTSVAEGETVKSFFVLHVTLKRKNFDIKTISLIPKLINQNILLVLEYEGESKLAVLHTKLIQSQWQPSEAVSIKLEGLNLDAVWENIIVQIGSIVIEEDKSLEEQIELDEKREKIKKEIARLERLARAEKQPRKKFELVQEINRLKKVL